MTRLLPAGFSFAALVLFAVLVGLGATGCERDLTPPLVELTSVEPREVDTLDRLELRGTGFPQGRRARVTFRGDVRRAGEGEVRGITIETEGVVASPERIEVVVTEALEERFCGRPEHAAHATFAGDVEVAFASSAPSAPPLAGEKRGITLDVRPGSVRPDVSESRTREATRFLSFLGVTVGTPSPRGMPIEAVAVGSVAERHGIAAGDVLASLDGLRVLELTDLVPISARIAQVGIRRGDAAAPEIRPITLVGYAGERIPSELAPALVVAGLALAALLLLVLPGPAVLVAAEVRVASRVRRTTWRSLCLALFGAGPVAVVSAVASVLVGTFALGPHVLAPELDGAVLLATSLGLLFVARLALAKGRFAFVKALWRFALPAVLLLGSLVGVVVLVGGYRLSELVRIQGGAPWTHTAARSPAAAALAFVYVASLLAITRVRGAAGEAALGGTAPATRSSAKRPAEVLERLGVLLASALGAAVFFGGWQIGQDATSHGVGVLLLAAVVFVLKSWVIAAAVLASASLGASWSWTEATAFSIRRLLPALLAAVLLLAASRHLTPPAPVEAAFGATLVAFITLLALRTTWRVRSALGRPEPHASPFL